MDFNLIPGLDGMPSNGAVLAFSGTAMPQEDPTQSLERLLAESRSTTFQQPHAQPTPPNGHMGPPPQVAPTPPPAQPQQEMKQEIKQEDQQENGTQPDAQDEIDVPQCLIYGGETGDDEFLIPGRSLQKLPKEALANVLREGERMGAFHRLGSTPHWESVYRMGQYLDNGEYKPFRPSTPLEYLDSAGTAILWNNKDSPNAVEIPRATYELFLREIDFYLYTAKIGFVELRRTIADRLCSRYPKSIHSIWAMVDKLPQIAHQNGDTALMQRLVSYINTNIKELSVLPEFVPLLRKLTRGRPPLGPVLLEAFISSSQAARRDLMKLTLQAQSGAIFASSPQSLRDRITGPASAVPAMPSQALPPPPAPRRQDFSSPLSAFEIPQIVDALRYQSLVIASDNGYGTLVKEGQKTARNREFEFLRGELLIADREATTVNGRHNIKVMNSKGEVGDILRTLVKKVPASLGVFPEGKHFCRQLLCETSIWPRLILFA